MNFNDYIDLDNNHAGIQERDAAKVSGNDGYTNETELNDQQYNNAKRQPDIETECRATKSYRTGPTRQHAHPGHIRLAASLSRL